MAASTLLPLGTQFFDAVGEPLAGGTLNFYTATTLTPKNVYTTQAGSVVLGTSVTLDGEGRIPSAGVWCLGSYRVIIKDSDGATINDIDTVNLYAPFDWSGLTATVSDLNSVAGALGTAGTVVASKGVVVDASKNISAFGVLTGATLRATTAVRTPQLNDANNVAAVTIASTSSQVNAVKITPATTGNDPSITAFGSDTNVDLALAGQGTGKVIVSGLTYPSADGSSGYIMQTNGSGVLSLVAPAAAATGVVKQVVTANTATYSAITAVTPFDDTIPQNTEGTEILTCAITPTSASSTLYIYYFAPAGSPTTTGTLTTALFVDSTANALTATTLGCSTSSLTTASVSLAYSVSAASTTARTYRIRMGVSGGTGWVNGQSGRKYGGVSLASIFIIEAS